MSVSGRRVVVWFRNDLRVTDNPALHRALSLLSRGAGSAGSAGERPGLLCVYCFDPRHFGVSPWGSKRTGVFRAQFLLESARGLRESLRSAGGELLVALGEPEKVIPALLRSGSDGDGERDIDRERDSEASSDVVVQGEVTWEELQVERRVERAMGARHRLHRVRGSELFHPEDLPFRTDLQDVPDVFTAFRTKVEKHCAVRALLPMVRLAGTRRASLAAGVESEQCGFDFLPSLRQLGFTEEEEAAVSGERDARGVMRFEGGEEAGQRRVREWMFRDDRLKDYFDIRNGMLGEAYSSKLSPWLALGCLSPR